MMNHHLKMSGDVWRQYTLYPEEAKAFFSYIEMLENIASQNFPCELGFCDTCYIAGDSGMPCENIDICETMSGYSLGDKYE